MSDEPLATLDPRFRRQLEKARRALGSGEAAIAVEITTPILHQHPGCVEARRLHQQALEEREESRRKSFLAGLSARPWQPRAPGTLRRDPRKVLRQAEDCIAAHPRAPQGHRMLAAAAEAMRLPHTALFALETLSALRPDDREALLQRAELHRRLGQSEAAIEVAEAALRQFPGARAFQDILQSASVAVSLEQGGWSGEAGPRTRLPTDDPAADPESGPEASRAPAGAGASGPDPVDDLRRQLAEDPGNPERHQRLAEALAAQGNYAEARATLALVRESPGGVADPSLRALEFTYRRRHLDRLVADRQAEMEAHPGDPARREAWEELVRERRERLLEETGQHVATYPHDLVARAEFGDLLLEAGRCDEAIRQYQQALRHPQARVGSRHGLGRAYATKGFHDLAEEQLRAAAADTPNLTEQRKAILYDLADVLEAMGRPEEAIGPLKEIYAADIGYRAVARRVEAYYGSAPGS
jgi:tetratricopeptide (TPR) repeat protein